VSWHKSPAMPWPATRSGSTSNRKVLCSRYPRRRPSYSRKIRDKLKASCSDCPERQLRRVSRRRDGLCRCKRARHHGRSGCGHDFFAGSLVRETAGIRRDAAANLSPAREARWSKQADPNAVSVSGRARTRLEIYVVITCGKDSTPQAVKRPILRGQPAAVLREPRTIPAARRPRAWSRADHDVPMTRLRALHRRTPWMCCAVHSSLLTSLQRSVLEASTKCGPLQGAIRKSYGATLVVHVLFPKACAGLKKFAPECVGRRQRPCLPRYFRLGVTAVSTDRVLIVSRYCDATHLSFSDIGNPREFAGRARAGTTLAH